MPANIINTKVTAPYDSATDLILTPPGAVTVNQSGNDNLYALYFMADNLTGTLNGAISSTGTGIETFGIKFINDGSLIFSVGKAAITVSGGQNAYGLFGGTLQLSAAIGPLAGSVNVTAKSAFTASATGFEAVAKFLSPLAMSIGVSATGGNNANAYGFGYAVNIAGGLDDKFKLNVTAKAGSGDASARGVAERLTVDGRLAGTFNVTADAAKGRNATAVGFNTADVSSNISDKFILTVTAKAGSKSATAYGATGRLTTLGALAGSVNVMADAAKGENAEAYGFFLIETTAVNDKFKYAVTAKAGAGFALARGVTDSINVSAAGVAAGSWSVTADAVKGTDASAYGASSILGGSVNDKLAFTVTAKAGSGSAYVQCLGGASSVNGAFAGLFTVIADAAKGQSASAYGLNGIFAASISDKFKLDITAKAGSSTASVMGINSVIYLNGALSGSINAVADAAKGTDANAVGTVGFSGITAISDVFKLNVAAKAGSRAAMATGGYGAISVAGVFSGSIVVSADAVNGTSAEAVSFDYMSSTDRFSDKFVLSVTAKAGSQHASAVGVSSSLEATGLISGNIAILADAAKGTGASSRLVNSSIIAGGGLSDKLKVAVTANAGTSDADASFAASMTLYGIFAGDIAVTANAAKGQSAVANGVTGSISGTSGMSNQLKMSVTALAGSGSAQALAVNATSGDWQLAGTVTVIADAAAGTSANACGFRYASGVGSVSDLFKLTVSAKAGTGAATAQGIGVADILSGTVTVTAESRSGIADAVGYDITFSTRSAVGAKCLIAVSAKSGGNTATAAGISGGASQITMAGQLAVTASGSPSSTAYGVRLNQLSTGSTFAGAVAAVGNHGIGIYGGDGSQLTVTGGVYGGTKGVALTIAKSLQKVVGSYKSALTLAKSADQSIRFGDDSNLTLAAGSVAIGSVVLGSDSMLNLSSGTQLCGDVVMNNGEINFTIDAKLDKAATVNLSSAAGASVFGPGSGVSITVTANADTQTGSYVLLAGSDLSALDGANFNALYHLSGFDTNDLVASWRLDHGKTDTLTLIVSEKPVAIILGSRELNSNVSLSASSSLTDELLTGDSAWKHTTLA